MARVPLPLPLQRRSSDEYRAAPYGPRDRLALAAFEATASGAARRSGRSPDIWAAERRGTAAALLAINQASGVRFYDVPSVAAVDGDAAEAALGGNQLVIDVQTHYVARERATNPPAAAVLGFIQSVAPERFRELRGTAQDLSLLDYLRCVFLESETAVAVLTSAPGEGERNILTNDEIAGTRELVDRLAGDGRLLHHAIVHPNLAGELERMQALAERSRPAGWKVYTLYGAGSDGRSGWRLDDDTTGLPFLERTAALGVRIVCAHKGLSQLAPTGSPADVGPAAAAFPDLDFLIYHAGYEIPGSEAEEERALPREPGAALRGTDRLVRSLESAGIGPGGNVYAEIGSTWFALLRRPLEAAHVLGKLLLAVGEDNVLWGTDSVWYGSPQPLIDAFRAFRIPAELCERHGYPALTPDRVEKILGRNAARVYGIEPERAHEAAQGDDLAWVRAALYEARSRGTPRLVAPRPLASSR